MKPKLKPDYDPESIQSDLIETVCNSYKPGVSVRALAKELELSPMKVRKILITGGVYSTDTSTEIGELYKDGKTVGEIAAILGCSVANVNSYLPYERIIYGMDERSVEADRQARYRDRKKGKIPPLEIKEEKPVIERVRNKTMIIVIGKKLRKLLPDGVFDTASDPLARDHATTVWKDGDWSDPSDPDKMIWCAELTSAGRGRGKKSGIVLMSANCGFVVICPLPPVPELRILSKEGRAQLDWSERRAVENKNRDMLKEYRSQLKTVFIGAIRDGLLFFSLPESRVLDYTDTVSRVELVKGKASTPAIRLEELIERDLTWGKDDDPVQCFNIRGNWTTRKFGNSGSYRHVDAHTCNMLGMDDEECQKWLMDFLAPMRETMTR